MITEPTADASRCGMVTRPSRFPGGSEPARKPGGTGAYLPPKEIADALLRAIAAGLLLQGVHSGPRWGVVACPSCHADRSVWSAPRDPAGHAKQVDRFTLRHTHE